MATGEPTSTGDFLIREVQEDGHTDIALDLQRAEEIKTRFPDNEEVTRKYEELRLATIGALRDLRIETSQELEEVKKSLTGNINFDHLAEEGAISGNEKIRIQSLHASLESENEQEIQNQELKTKDIDAMTQGEAEIILRISQEEYGKYTESGNATEIINMAGSLFSSSENTYENITDKREMNLFQEALLVKIYGDEINSVGYTDTHIKTFSEGQGGNGVIEIVDFENNLKNTPPEEWNSLALVHYFKMLDSQGNFDISVLIKKLGATQLIALRNLWETTPNGSAMQYFQGNESLKWIVSGEIDYDGILQSRENFEELSLLFDAVDESERDKIRETIRYYFTDFISEGKDMSVIEGIAGSENLGDVSDGMYRFIIEEARRTLIGQEFLDTMNVRYRGVPDIGGVLKAIMITILQERGVVDGELGFDFTGMNEMISTYNQENHSFLPLIGEETRETLKNLFSSGQILSQFSENKQQLNEVQSEIERLQNEITLLENRLLSAENDRDVQSLTRQINAKRSTLSRYYNDQYRINRTVEVNEDNLEDITTNLSENLISNASGRSLSYILASPETRISLITSPTQLIDIFKTNPDIFQNIHLRNINIFLTRNTDVIKQFPGKIDSDDIHLIPESILLEKDVLRKIRTVDTSGRDALLQDVLEKITQGRILLPERLREIYALLRDLSHEQAINGYALPSILRSFHSETTEEKIVLQEGEISEEISLGKVQEIVSGLLIGDEMYENDFGKINTFIQENGYSEEIEEQLKMLLDAKPDYYSGLWSVRGKNEFRNIHIFVLEKDINNFKYLSFSQKKETQYIEKVLEHINTSEGNIQEYLDILNLIPIENWDDVMKMMHLTEDYELLEKFQNVSIEQTRGFIDKVIQAYENSSESRKRLIFERPEELEIYQQVVGIRGTLERARTIGTTIESVRENEKDFSGTLSYIEGLSLTNEEKERLKEILQNSENAIEFSNQFTAYILEISAGDEEKIGNIISGMLEAVAADLAREKAEVSTAPPSEEEERDYAEWFERGEANETHLDEILLRNRFLEVTRRLSDEEIRSMSEAEIIEIFLEEHNIDSDHTFATRLRNFLTIEAQQVKIQAARRNTPAYIEAVRTGKTDEYWSNIRRQYYSGEISYTPDIPKTPVPPESFSSQNPEFIVFRREIGTQMGLTLAESDTLTQQEVQILGGDNDKAKDNFKLLIKSFHDANMQNLFPLRHEIMKSISNVNGIAFSLEREDYLSENEMMILLGEITYAALGKKAQNIRESKRSLEQSLSTISNLNNDASGFFTTQRNDIDLRGNSYIEHEFLAKFTRLEQGNIGDFNSTAFERALQA